MKNQLGKYRIPICKYKGPQTTFFIFFMMDYNVLNDFILANGTQLTTCVCAVREWVENISEIFLDLQMRTSI